MMFINLLLKISYKHETAMGHPIAVLCFGN